MVHLRKFILCSFWIPARAVNFDVVMEQYHLRHSKKVLKRDVTQGYAKPVDGDLVDVLQLFFDDSMSDLKFDESNIAEPYPGGNVAFVETATVYSHCSLQENSAGVRVGLSGMLKNSKS